MTFLTHTVVTTVGIQVLNLKAAEVVLAYVFGVLVDLDHIFKLPLYYKKFGFGIKRHYNWRTPLQEPISLMWIIPISIYFGTYVPILFFLGHLVLDYVYNYEKRPFFPFNGLIVKRVFKDIPDFVKEGSVFITFLCLSIILFLKRI